VLDALVGVDRIVHMGAYPSPHGHPDDVIYSSNTRSTYLVLAEGAKRGVDRAVVASSVAAVGIAWAPHELAPEYVPIDEEHPFVVEDPYGLSKRVVEDICAMVTQRWSVDTMAMRFPFIGRGERLERHLAEFAANPLKTRRELWGWIHTEDAVRAVTASLFGAWSGHHVVNVAAPDSGLDIPTEQLISEYLPGVEVRRELPGFASLYDSSRIGDLIGFEARSRGAGGNDRSDIVDVVHP